MLYQVKQMSQHIKTVETCLKYRLRIPCSKPRVVIEQMSVDEAVLNQIVSKFEYSLGIGF